MTDKLVQVTAIESGTVIDHIPSDSLFKIISILDLEKETSRVTFGSNLESKRMGKKAIIKINDRYCAQDEINRIALIAPMAVVNIIKNFNVVEKLEVRVPDKIGGFVKCANPQCITNHESIATKFTVLKIEDSVSLRCKYCDKITYQSEIELIKK
ncbi:MAG: aspartate carbamoyltransferase regulatory subunit [Rikenellaceae bacterium]